MEECAWRMKVGSKFVCAIRHPYVCVQPKERKVRAGGLNMEDLIIYH